MYKSIKIEFMQPPLQEELDELEQANTIDTETEGICLVMEDRTILIPWHRIRRVTFVG